MCLFILTIVVVGYVNTMFQKSDEPQPTVTPNTASSSAEVIVADAVIPSKTLESGDGVFASIENFKTSKPQQRVYVFEGYVVKKYTCPPCPAGAQCKACMKNNIVVSDTDMTMGPSYTLTNAEVIIFTQEADRLELHKKYRFKVRLTDKRSTSEPINDLELVDFD